MQTLASCPYGILNFIQMCHTQPNTLNLQQKTNNSNVPAQQGNIWEKEIELKKNVISCTSTSR